MKQEIVTGQSALTVFNSQPFYIASNCKHIHQGIIRELQPMNINMSDVEIANVVMGDNRINALGCRIPIKSNWNLPLMWSLSASASDREVVQYLTFGWPINRDDTPLTQTYRNHASARTFRTQVSNYLLKEWRLGTLIGPLVTSPFPLHKTGILPMSTRPKKNTSKRRIILDLSWPPEGNLVNSGIPKDTFVRVPCRLVYPMVELLCKRAASLKQQGVEKIYAWKKDMDRAFKQIPLDPVSWAALGMWWEGALFFDKTAVMGCRSAPYICQWTTNFIRHVLANIEYVVFNYIDDFMSLDAYENACRSYIALGNLLRDLGVHVAEEKSVFQTQIIEFLGVLYDFVQMTISLPEEKMVEIKQLLRIWLKKKDMTVKQLQKLVGKLQFAACCVCAGRVFMNRMYDMICEMQEGQIYNVPRQVWQDVRWWHKYMKEYDGKSIMWLVQKQAEQNYFTTDACLVGAGGMCQGSYYHKKFLQWLFDKYENIHIMHLEMLAIITGLKVLGQHLYGKKFMIGCDNQAVVNIINAGRSRDQLLQDMLQELMYCLAKLDAELVAQFLPGKSNHVSDMLSRYYVHKKFRLEFEGMKHVQWEECVVHDNLLKMCNNW